MEIDALCPHCKRRIALEKDAPCPFCHQKVVQFPTQSFRKNVVEQCVLCASEHLYRHRDFNRKLGIALVAVGIALAYFTYGISILVLTALDFWLYKRVGEVVSCYRCGTVYRGASNMAQIEPFKLSLHDYYRSLPAT